MTTSHFFMAFCTRSKYQQQFITVHSARVPLRMATFPIPQPLSGSKSKSSVGKGTSHFPLRIYVMNGEGSCMNDTGPITVKSTPSAVEIFAWILNCGDQKDRNSALRAHTAFLLCHFPGTGPCFKKLHVQVFLFCSFVPALSLGKPTFYLMTTCGET